MEWLSRKPAPALLAALLLASAAAADILWAIDQSDSSRKCSLEGTWVNDLNSTMHISPPDDAGAFSGSYRTKVTTTSNQPGNFKESPLYGAQHHPDERAQPTFAFIVHWKFTDSTTAFVGQCFVDEKGVEMLETLWLLRSEVPKHGDDWKATLIGKNVFTRVMEK